MAQAQILTVRPAHAHQRLLDAVKRVWGTYLAHRARKATVLALRTLDDRTLKDLGMDRSEIESVVYARAYDRPGASGRRVTMCLGPAGRC